MECQENLDQLYKTANDIVGRVGEINTHKGEEVVILFEDDKDLFEKWEHWVKGYKTFAKHRFQGSVNWTLEPVTIYWDTKPEYLKHRKGIYAQLLITNQPKRYFQGRE